MNAIYSRFFILLTCLVTFAPNVSAITSGQSVSGTILVAGEEDTYQISGNTGGSIFLSAGGSIPLAIELFRPSGTLVQSSSGSTGRLSSTNLPETGTYSIRIRAYSASATGTYELHAVSGGNGSEYGSVASGFTHTGSITTGDIDSFSLQGETGGSIMLSGGGDLSISVHLMAPDGSYLGSSNGSTGRRIYTNLPATGTYTALVWSYGVGVAADYQFHAASGGNGSEYGSVASGFTHTGSITTGDIDSFSLQGEQGGSIMLSGAGDLSISVHLMAPDGSYLGSSNGSTGRRIYTNLPATGVYTALAWSYGTGISADYQFHAVSGGNGSEYGAVASGGTFADELTPGDIDSFSISGLQGGSIDLDASGDLAVVVHLMAPNGSFIGSSSGSSGQRLYTNLPQTGTYTASVWSYTVATTGNYQQSFSSTPLGDIAPFGSPDGIVDVADALIATRIVAGELAAGALELERGDMNGDATLDLSDLILIMKLVVGE